MNFDKAVAQLRREARHLLRLGATVPPAARAVLLQDEKLSAYRARLTFLVKVRIRSNFLMSICPTRRNVLCVNVVCNCYHGMGLPSVAVRGAGTCLGCRV